MASGQSSRRPPAATATAAVGPPSPLSTGGTELARDRERESKIAHPSRQERRRRGPRRIAKTAKATEEEKAKRRRHGDVDEEDEDHDEVAFSCMPPSFSFIDSKG
jgi:hypothetical protein